MCFNTLLVLIRFRLFPDAGDYVLDVPKKKDTAKSESTGIRELPSID